MRLRSFLLSLSQIILIILALQSCQCISHNPIFPGEATYHYNLYVSQDFDTDEVDMIEAAALEWQEKTNSIITYSIYFNWDNKYESIPNKYHSLAVVKLSKWGKRAHELDIISGEKDKPATILGYFDNGQKVNTIYLVYDRMLGLEYYRGTLEHELGHSIGLDHLKEENTLMYPSMDKGAKHITGSDLKQFCEIYSCKTKNLKH